MSRIDNRPTFNMGVPLVIPPTRAVNWHWCAQCRAADLHGVNNGNGKALEWYKRIYWEMWEDYRAQQADTLAALPGMP